MDDLTIEEEGCDLIAATRRQSGVSLLADYATDDLTPLQRAVQERLAAWGIHLAPHTRLRPGLEPLSRDPADFIWDGESFLARIRIGQVWVPAAVLIGRISQIDLAERIATVQVAYWWSKIALLQARGDLR